MSSLTVAVVVPAFNAAQTLPHCLQALLIQTRPPDQIIVVDDGSTDHTAEAVAAFSGVIYIRQENAGPACARNRGEREASTDVVLFTDSDCEPEPDWVETTLRGFQHKGVGVVSGSYAIKNPDSRLARCIHEEIIYRHQHLMPDFPRSFGSYNFAVLRDVFSRVGGFDESYRTASGEDNDLSYKIRKAGYKIYFERNSKVAHVHPQRVSRYLREQFRHGFWRVKMYHNHPHMAGGDDYTFWKDIWEIGLAGALGLSSLLAILGIPGMILTGAGLLGVLSLLQLWWCGKFCQGFSDNIFFSLVLLARSFARMTGFSTGVVCSLIFSGGGKKGK